MFRADFFDDPVEKSAESVWVPRFPQYAEMGTNTDLQDGVRVLPQEVLLYLLGATPFGWNLAFSVC